MSYTKTGRSEAILAGLAHAPPAPIIVEVGSTRNSSDAARLSDGWATLTFAEWVRDHGGVVHSIDPRPRMGEIQKVLGGLSVFVHPSKIESWTSWPDPVDVLYLDGPNHPEPHLAAAREAVARGCTVVLCDDVIHADYGPKATTAVPYLLGQGFEILAQVGRVLILTRIGETS